jgi:hypothetical protein
MIFSCFQISALTRNDNSIEMLSFIAGSGGGAEAEPVQHCRQGEDRDADQGGRGHHPLCPRIEADADAESASGDPPPSEKRTWFS